MASAGAGRSRRWLARAWRTCLLVGLAASVAGCVGMPNSGSPGTFGATPQDTSQDSDFIGAVPAGPQPGWSPANIVTGFLNATVSYPAYSTIAGEYLASSVPRNWAPSWSVTVVDKVNVSPEVTISDGGRRAVVDVTGAVQASFNGTGQYVGPQQDRHGTQTASQQFTLVKEGKQWRITNPPKFRLLTEPDFAQVYKPQDLYFFDSNGQVLVPAAVFVPTGTSPTSLATNLVRALLNDPQPKWLQSQGDTTPPAVTAFPVHSTATNVNVTVDGTTATVNLTGAAASADPVVRGQMATQLVWTLTGQPGSPPNIQAVQLEFNGKSWTPPRPPCPTVGGQSTALKQAMYECKNPYPAATSSVFYYVANGQAWSRCAAETQVTTGLVGQVVPVFNRTGAAALNQSCKSVSASSPAVPPSQAHAPPPLSMVAMSPDGKYLAGVSPGGKSVTVWAVGATKPSSPLSMSGVTAISWDRRDYLWVAQGNITTMIVQNNGSKNHAEITNYFPGGQIIGLSIAPDGVRVAAIVQTDSGPAVELAAIDSGGSNPGQSGPGQSGVGKPGPDWRGDPFVGMSIGSTVQLGPNMTHPIALTWYDADDLLVLDGAGDQTSLWEVPVDGQPATKLPGVPPGAISITANSARNALVVGMTRNQLEISAGLEGPWQPLGSGGQNPAFQTPAVPAPGQS